MKTLTLLTLAITTSIASADSLPKEVENMDCLLGNWKGSGTMQMGKDKAKLDATYTCKKTGGDFGILCNLRITGIPGMAAYEETDLMGYEPNTKTYHWFSVTNAGETHDHAAPYTESNKIRFTYNGKQEGKPFKEIADWEFSGGSKTEKPNAVKVRGETFVGNASTSVIELAMKKL
jgi:hypothetical protein